MMSTSNHPFIVGIVGPTGSGKTTLAQNLAHHHGWDLHLEEPANNPYLETFYDELREPGTSAIALKSQLYFLFAAQAQAQLMFEANKPVVWDVPIYGHKMYADLLRAKGKMTEDDYQLYLQAYQLCLKTIPQPDVLIVVVTDVVTLVNRIAQRGREMELETPSDYWQSQIEYWQAKPDMGGVPTVYVNSAEVNWLLDTGVETISHLVSPFQASHTTPSVIH